MFLEKIFKHSVIFFLIIVILYLLLNSVTRLNITNTKWLKSDNEFEISRIELIEDFNDTEKLTISISTEKQFFDRDILNEISEFTDNAEKISQIKSVTTPLNSAYLIKHQDNLHNISLKYALEKQIINLAEIPQLLENSFYQDILFNAELNKFNIVIEPNLTENKILTRVELLKQVRELIDAFNLLQKDYYLSGKTFLYYQLDQKNKRNIYRLSAMILLFTLLFISCIYREKNRVIITALNSVMSLFITLSLFSILNVNFSLLSLCLPVVVIIVTISDSIFIFNRYNQNNISSYGALIGRIWKPCFITSLTTSFSFISYFFSDIKPLNDLAILAPIGIFINYLWVVFATPMILIFLNTKRIAAPVPLKSFLKKIYEFVGRANIWVPLRLVLVLVVISPSIFFIKSETNFLNIFFFKSEKIVENILKFDQEFVGSSDFSLVYNESVDNDFKEIEFFAKVQNNTKEIKSLSKINDTRSYEDITLDTLRKLSENRLEFSNSEELEQVLLFLEFSRNEESHDVLSDYINFDYTKGRVKLYTDNLSSSEIGEVSKAIKDIITREQIQNIKLAGTNAYFDGISGNLIATQFYSLLFMLLMVFCSILLFYNFKMALIATIANMMPLMSLAIICSCLQINFDFAFVLVTVICFGITIDSTIHILHEYSLKGDLKEAITKTGLAVSEISLLFIVCFATFFLSDLLIFVKFATLAILTISLAYFVNIVLLPIALKKS